MKRDFDLIRKLLIEYEDAEWNPNRYYGVDEDGLDKYSKNQVLGHIELMGEAGLLIVKEITVANPPEPPRKEFVVFRITWEGYEFLDRIRDDGVWKEIKNRLFRFGGLTYPIISELALEILKSRI